MKNKTIRSLAIILLIAMVMVTVLSSCKFFIGKDKNTTLPIIAPPERTTADTTAPTTTILPEDTTTKETTLPPKDTTTEGTIIPPKDTTTGGNETPESEAAVKVVDVSVSRDMEYIKEMFPVIPPLPRKLSYQSLSKTDLSLPGNVLMDDIGFVSDGSDNNTNEMHTHYTVIYRGEKTIYLTITLDNPNNYYIMDFKLSCEVEDIKVKQGNHYNSINDPNTFIRWDEAIDRVGNRQATFELQLSDPSINPETITISEMYYSDRTDGTNKTNVNMNNFSQYSIYKVEFPFTMNERKNSFTEFTFRLTPSVQTTINKVTVDGVEYTPDGNSDYHIPGGKLRIEYTIHLEPNVTYDEYYEEDIVLLQLVRTNAEKKITRVDYNEMEHKLILYYRLIGTDTHMVFFNSFPTVDPVYFKNDIEEGFYFLVVSDKIQMADSSPWDPSSGKEIKFVDLIITIAGTEFNVFNLFEANEIEYDASLLK